LRALQYKKQKETLEQEMRQLEATNAALRQEIDKLRSDRRYIEGIARKELGMVRADEMVYQFPSRPTPVKAAGAAEAAPSPAVSAE
jgi:cell division protein FtsB